MKINTKGTCAKGKNDTHKKKKTEKKSNLPCFSPKHHAFGTSFVIVIQQLVFIH